MFCIHKSFEALLYSNQHLRAHLGESLEPRLPHLFLTVSRQILVFAKLSWVSFFAIVQNNKPE